MHVTTARDKQKRFETLYTDYSPKIHRLCMGYTGNAMEADDLHQEVFIKAWQHFDQFRGESQLSTWIYRIAVNICLQYVRSLKTKKTTALNEQALAKPEHSENTELQLQQLYTCIAGLADADRLIITLVLEGVSYSEIAVIADISEGNLRVKLHRIKQQLSKCYSHHERI